MDPALIMELWPYLRPDKVIPGDAEMREKAYELGLELKQDLEDAISRNNYKISVIEQKFPNIEDD